MGQIPAVHPLPPALRREFIDYLSAQQQNAKTSCGYPGRERIAASLAKVEHDWTPG